jgi:hemerythrin
LNFSEREPEIAAFQWIPAYAVGVDEIDADHRHLFRLAGRLQAAMQNGAGKDLLGDLLDGLVAYTCQHFAREESLMKSIGYPELALHRRQHQAIRARVAAMRQRAATGESTMTIEVLEFLVGWMRTHIAGSDRQIAAYQRQLTRCGRASRTPRHR